MCSCQYFSKVIYYYYHILQEAIMKLTEFTPMELMEIRSQMICHRESLSELLRKIGDVKLQSQIRLRIIDIDFIIKKCEV